MFKKSISLFVLSISLVCGSKARPAFAMQVPRENLFASSSLGSVQLYHDDASGFTACINGKMRKVQNCFVDEVVRNINSEELGYFLGNIKDVEIDGKVQTFYKIAKEDFDHVVRDAEKVIVDKITPEELTGLASQLSGCSNYLEIVELSNKASLDGEIAIHAKIGLQGGGIIGTIIGCTVGKVVVSLVGHGAIAVVAIGTTLVAGPVAGWATAVAGESVFGHAIEVASIKGAMIGGLAGGTMTGPI